MLTKETIERIANYAALGYSNAPAFTQDLLKHIREQDTALAEARELIEAACCHGCNGLYHVALCERRRKWRAAHPEPKETP